MPPPQTMRAFGGTESGLSRIAAEKVVMEGPATGRHPSCLVLSAGYKDLQPVDIKHWATISGGGVAPIRQYIPSNAHGGCVVRSRKSLAVFQHVGRGLWWLPVADTGGTFCLFHKHVFVLPDFTCLIALIIDRFETIGQLKFITPEKYPKKQTLGLMQALLQVWFLRMWM